MAAQLTGIGVCATVQYSVIKVKKNISCISELTFMQNNHIFKVNIFSLSLYKHSILVDTKLLRSSIIYCEEKEYPVAHKAITFKWILLQEKHRLT